MLVVGDTETVILADIFNDLYQLDISNLAWINLTGPAQSLMPGPRAGHGLVSANGRLFVFGGYYGTWVSSKFSIS